MSWEWKKISITLHWLHNDHDGVSNHQPHGCLLNRLFRRGSKKTSKLRVTGLCVGNSPGPVNSPHKGPVTRKMFPFEDVIMMLILETQLKKGERISIKGYRFIHKPRTNNKGGSVRIVLAEKLAQHVTEDNSTEHHDQIEMKLIHLECRPKHNNEGIIRLPPHPHHPPHPNPPRKWENRESQDKVDKNKTMEKSHWLYHNSPPNNKICKNDYSGWRRQHKIKM